MQIFQAGLILSCQYGSTLACMLLADGISSWNVGNGMAVNPVGLDQDVQNIKSAINVRSNASAGLV
jgi:hypothetical protein